MKTKKIWNYHPVYGTLISEGLADESPEEPGVLHIPAYATDKMPPTDIPEGTIAIFKTVGWTVERLPEQAQVESPVTENQEPADTEIEEDLSPAATRLRAKVARNWAVSQLTVTVGDQIFQADEESQNRIVRAIADMNISQALVKVWILADNSIAEVTQDQLKEVLAKAVQEQDKIWII